jgi:hypothetical protein
MRWLVICMMYPTYLLSLRAGLECWRLPSLWGAGLAMGGKSAPAGANPRRCNRTKIPGDAAEAGVTWTLSTCRLLSRSALGRPEKAPALSSPPRNQASKSPSSPFCALPVDAPAVWLRLRDHLVCLLCPHDPAEMTAVVVLRWAFPLQIVPCSPSPTTIIYDLSSPVPR